ncbi:1-phosphofructokinase [Gracilibacillus halotolerans]|uniref:Tagatose-6-phosphate kinase n=1 Tax=Gracilibacillus halotolerans TaxID=74386 RepID=A0A841RPW9_9BACI|nr:1-phosphofructokinase [Gracilibacillus halotolerans]MBB6513225.1 1-phosphofructokinase [Gracilibacillus halotolerans]
MIYTCTLNPSIDYRIEADQLKLGHLNRANISTFYPGGKGINVSRVLNNLDTENTALGFLGGFTGKFIVDYLNGEEVNHSFVSHDGPTRVNVKLKETDRETEINGVGAKISNESREALIEKIKMLKKGDYLVLSGSLPTSLEFSYYKELSQICYENEVSLIIDISYPELKDLLQYRPLLIKPNKEELNQILGKELTTIEEILEGGQELQRLGAQNVMISLGGEGAAFVNEKETLIAIVPQGKVKSTVGSGDSMVAGFLSSYMKSLNIEQAFRYSVAAGSATAFSHDLCKREEVENLLPKIQIKHYKL